MKVAERNRARALRIQGRSVGEIARITGCSKSSISCWVRDIPLSEKQIERLQSNKSRGLARAALHPNSPRQRWSRIREDVMQLAEREIPIQRNLEALKTVGAALYWAEGYKAGRNLVSFSNSDPEMIRLMMVFFREACQVPPEKFRGTIHIHPHLNAEKARQFWSNISGIPMTQFHKTQMAVSRASREKRDTLPLGTFSIVISDTRLQCKILGWIRGMHKWTARAISSVGQSGGFTFRRSLVRAQDRPLNSSFAGTSASGISLIFDRNTEAGFSPVAMVDE